MIPSMIYNMGSGILRALGDSKRPLLFLVVCTIVNTILDLFFVAVLKLEVAGAAIATSLSQLICAWLVIRTLQRAHGDYLPGPQKNPPGRVAAQAHARHRASRRHFQRAL